MLPWFKNRILFLHTVYMYLIYFFGSSEQFTIPLSHSLLFINKP